MYELGRLRPRFTCAGEYMPSNLYGAVACIGYTSRLPGTSVRVTPLSRGTGPQRARGITKAQTGPVVIELCVFCEEGWKLRVATRDERGFEGRRCPYEQVGRAAGYAGLKESSAEQTDVSATMSVARLRLHQRDARSRGCALKLDSLWLEASTRFLDDA